MTLRAIIFDIGDVLDALDDKRWWLAQREAMAAQLGLSSEKLWDILYKDNPLWEKNKRGQISDEAYWDGVLSQYGITDRTAQGQFVVALFKDRPQINPTMRALLDELRPNYKLAVLSNTFRLELENWLIQNFGLAGVFDVVVGSADVGIAKPEPRIYQLVLEKLNVAPAEALFIDDLPRNTSAAEVLGIASIVFESPAQLQQELAARGILS